MRHSSGGTRPTGGPTRLQGGGGLADGVAPERAVLEPLRQEADVVVDTSELSRSPVAGRGRAGVRALVRSAGSSLTVASFGFQVRAGRWTPTGASTCGLPDQPLLDTRAPGPHRPRTGVPELVLSQERATEFLDRYVELIDLISGGYQREGKRTSRWPSAAPSESIAASRSPKNSAAGSRASPGSPGRPPRPVQGVVESSRAEGGGPGGGWPARDAHRAGRAARRHHRRGHRRRSTAALRPAAPGGPGIVPPGDLRMALTALAEPTEPRTSGIDISAPVPRRGRAGRPPGRQHRAGRPRSSARGSGGPGWTRPARYGCPRPGGRHGLPALDIVAEVGGPGRGSVAVGAIRGQVALRHSGPGPSRASATGDGRYRRQYGVTPCTDRQV